MALGGRGSSAGDNSSASPAQSTRRKSQNYNKDLFQAARDGNAEAGPEEETIEISSGFHQLTVVAVCHTESNTSTKLIMLAVSYTLLFLQLVSLLAMTYSTAKRHELEGLVGEERTAKLAEMDQSDYENVQTMRWSDWCMFVLVNAVIAFTMQQVCTGVAGVCRPTERARAPTTRQPVLARACQSTLESVDQLSERAPPPSANARPHLST